MESCIQAVEDNEVIARMEVWKMGTARNLCKEEKRGLKTLADDFGLLYRADVQEIIDTCRGYTEGQQKIMRIYENVYMR